MNSQLSGAARCTACNGGEAARGQVLLDLASQCRWWCERTKAVLRAQAVGWEQSDSFTEKPVFVPSLHSYTTDTVFCCSAPSFVPMHPPPPLFFFVSEQVAIALASRVQMRKLDSWLLRTWFGILDYLLTIHTKTRTFWMFSSGKHDKAMHHLAHGADQPSMPLLPILPPSRSWEVSLQQISFVCVYLPAVNAYQNSCVYLKTRACISVRIFNDRLLVPQLSEQFLILEWHCFCLSEVFIYL